MLNTRINRYFTPEELEGEDDIPVDEETLTWTIDIFTGDFDPKKIIERLYETPTKVVSNKWEVCTISLGDLREEYKTAFQKYDMTLFPVSWTNEQIMAHYISKNNTVWNHLAKFSWAPKRQRKKFIIQPECDTETSDGSISENHVTQLLDE